MATEQEPITARRLEQLTYQQGRRDADVDRHLLDHDRSIMKLEEATGQINDKLDVLLAAHGVDEALAAEREKRSSTGLTKFQTWAIAIGVPAGFTAAILAPFIAHWLGH